MNLSKNNRGDLMCPVSFTMAELNELVLLIDDEPVDENFLGGIRRKLVNRRKAFRRAVRDQNNNTTAHQLDRGDN